VHIDPQTIDPTAVYKLLISSVVPRPIAWVSSLDGAGVANLAPFSYFMAITAEPPTIAFSCSPREGGKKDTLRNVESTGEFVVNVVDDVPNCDFAAPAVVRRGDLVVAVGTGGRAPALASRLRAELGERFGPEWAELVELVGDVRAATLGDLPDLEERARRWRAALDLAELERLVRAGRGDLAADRLRTRLLERSGSERAAS